MAGEPRTKAGKQMSEQATIGKHRFVDTHRRNLCDLCDRYEGANVHSDAPDIVPLTTEEAALLDALDETEARSEAASSALRRIREGVAGLPIGTDEAALASLGDFAVLSRRAVLRLIDTEIGAGEPG